MNTWFIDEDDVLRLVEGDSTEGYALKCWAKDDNATMQAGGKELHTTANEEDDTQKEKIPFLTEQTMQEARAMLERAAEQKESK